MTFTRRQWPRFSPPLRCSPRLHLPRPPCSLPRRNAKKANADVREVSQRLASIDLPLGVEPAFRFIA